MRELRRIPTAAPRRLARDDLGVTEVIGFILMFAMSAIILIVSMRAFTAAQDNSNDLLAAVELKNVANRISSRIVQVGLIAQEFPQAEFSVALRIPDEVAGYRYSVQFEGIGSEPFVYARTEGLALTGESTLVTGQASIFKVNEVKVNDLPIYLVPGAALSSAGVVTVHYWLEDDPAGGADPAVREGHIQLKGGTV